MESISWFILKVGFDFGPNGSREGFWSMEFGIGNWAPMTIGMDFGPWNLDFGICYLLFGI
jgi:hypothetical protein